MVAVINYNDKEIKKKLKGRLKGLRYLIENG